MITQFSWIDASKLPVLADTARQQPVRNRDGLPTPGGLVCHVAASRPMVVPLCAPVMHPMYTTLIRRLAAMTCNACGCKASNRATKCPGCDAKPVPRAAFAADAIQRATWIKFGTDTTPPRHVLALQNVIAPALWVRPTQTMPDGRLSDDHLTTHLACIVRTDNRCRKTKAVHGSQSVAHAAARHHLQRTVHKYFGFSPPNCRKAQSRDTHQPGVDTGLKHRLNGKTGRMRGSLLGWRLGEVARCVAQPAPPDMPVDTVIVPQKIARALGGMQNGAVCLLNRQPTLGVGSIFAVRAQISRNPDSYVLQVSTWLCASLNLDFDGDEVNLHHITDTAAQYEALLLCGVDAIMRCNITQRVRIQPCHAHKIAHWLMPSKTWAEIDSGHPVTMLRAMQATAADAEATLRQRTVSIGLQDVLPLSIAHHSHMLKNVPKTSHVAHLAQAMRRMPPRGALANLIQSGAKGKFSHLVQLRCLLGQQLRWSDTHSSDNGYIDRCFAQGLTVSQAVDHAMSARVGQVDQAVKTRTVGYLRRRLMALLENVTIEHDGTARLVSDNVIQFQHADNFEAGDAAGCMSATILGHAAFQASLDAFKYTDAASTAAPGLPAFLHMVSAPGTPEANGNWSPHNATSGVPQPWVPLEAVAVSHITKCSATELMLVTRQVMGWTRPPIYNARVRVVTLRQDAMIAHGVQPHDVAWAVRHANQDKPVYDCTIAADGKSVILWDDVRWQPRARVTGCRVQPSTTPCAVQAQRLMDAHHVTSCCVATRKVLGVEAARALFMRMTVHHLGLQDAMPAVQLAADVLFWSGQQIPLTRNGLQQQLPLHALCRAAYETTISVFADAATQKNVDPGTTVSARVCRRRAPKLGTHGPSKIFTTETVVEKQPCRHKDTILHPGYEVFNFLQPEQPPQKCRNKFVHKPHKKARWADAPWQPASWAC